MKDSKYGVEWGAPVLKKEAHEMWAELGLKHKVCG
jgi:hypothetical protein